AIRNSLKCAMKLNDDFSMMQKTQLWEYMIKVGMNELCLEKIRSMNYNSCKRLFDINVYMSKYPKGKENALIVQKIPTMTFSSYIKKRKNSNISIEEKKNEKREKKCVAS
ncbi:hypothetical protein PFLG_02576, partial [Plasmodium falciparum RAJ116]